MATPERSWRDYITPAVEEHSRAVAEKLKRPRLAWPESATVDDLAELSIARVTNPDITIWDIVGDDTEQGSLHLHLTGPAVNDHGVDAAAFTTFVARMHDTISSTAKSISHRQRHRARLEVVAPKAASFAFDIRPVAPPTTGETVTRDVGVGIDSEALRAVTTVLSQARDGDHDALASAVDILPDQARKKLRAAFQAVRKQGWDIDGSLRQAKHPTVDLVMGQEATARLCHALDAKTTDEWVEEFDAQIVGFRGDDYIVWLKRLRDGVRVPSSVNDLRIMRKVREIAADEETIVHTSVRVTERPSKTNPASIRTSRVLTGIDIIAEAQQLPLG